MLAFSPIAWLKLKFFCHAGDTEVGGFAVSSPDDPLYIQDFVTVRQFTTGVTVEFDDAAVADHFDAAVDAGLPPARFARIWCHTHPGDSPDPSATDEETFARVFGACDWSVMFILSRTGRTYARLAFSAGPGGAVLLPVAVDWEAWPRVALERPEVLAGAPAEWAVEFERNVHPVRPPRRSLGDSAFDLRLADGPWWELEDLHAQRMLGERAEDDVLRLVEAGEGVIG